MKNRYLRIVLPIILFAAIYSCNLQKIRITEWTAIEVKKWANENTNSTWRGLILYQGSDTVYHHFIGRWMDEWAWFNIKRKELTLDDIRLYINSSTAPFGYYYVDPNKNFVKVKDY